MVKKHSATELAKFVFRFWTRLYLQAVAAKLIGDERLYRRHISELRMFEMGHKDVFDSKEYQDLYDAVDQGCAFDALDGLARRLEEIAA